jgi:hypothetical protein
MPNKKEHKLKLGDNTYKLKFTAGGLIQLEDLLDMESGEIQMKLQQGSMRIIRAMIFVGTRKHHKRDLRTEQDITPLMDEVEDFNEGLLMPLMEAYQDGFPGMQIEDDEEEESDEITPRRRGRKAAAASGGGDSEE